MLIIFYTHNIIEIFPQKRVIEDLYVLRLLHHFHGFNSKLGMRIYGSKGQILARPIQNFELEK